MTEQAHIDALKRSGWGSAQRDLTWRYLRPHWRRLTGVVVMAFASSGAELARMGLLLAFLGAAPLRIAHWVPRIALETGPLLAGLVVVSVGAAGLDWWRRHVALQVQRDFTESLRADVCMAMLQRPLDWFTANPAGQASYLLNGQVGRFSTLVPMASDGVAAILQGTAVVGLMLWMSVPLTGLALASWAVLWLALHPLQRRIRVLSVQVSVDSGNAAAKAEECAYAIKLIKSCRTEAYERDRYATLARILAEKQVRLSDLRNAAGGVTLIGFVGILAAAVWAAPNGTVLAGFGILLLRLYPCLTKLIEARTALATMSGHLAAVAEFMVPVVPSVTPEWEMKNRQFMCGAPEDAIATNNLGVFYAPAQPVLDGISLVIRRGEATALVGLTGSGKTTLLDTLAGLRHPQRGYFHLSAKTGYMTQEPILLFGTVPENILYEQSGRAHPVADAGILAHSAFAGMLASLLSVHVGQSGSRLSGGQRQLVALARLAWRDPDVWLLDEPTNAMDAETEAAVLDFLLAKRISEYSTRKRILLMATHKLSLAARFDRILVLHHGKIIQDGTHEELVKADGLYQRLWNLQEIN